MSYQKRAEGLLQSFSMSVRLYVCNNLRKNEYMVIRSGIEVW